MELDKNYQPKLWEDKIYKLWEDSGALSADTGSDQQPFVIVLPPPNANASLHVGHALDFQIKDVVARHKRLKGQPVLMIPGADHAGFETWSVYEKHLRSQGLSVLDFQRDELYQKIYDFVIENKITMENQIRKLGTSCDWSKLTFTLDDKVVKTAYETFKKMWQEGYIYRAKRLVNYCPEHQTTFSDYEVSHKDVQSMLYLIDYPVIDSENRLTVATTRPETLFGDVAVAVHPDDKRYAHLHGKFVNLPLVGKKIPIITDEAVKTDFGTGVLKITPGSDFLDFEIGQRHNLSGLEILDEQGRLNHNVPEKFQKLTSQQARPKVITELEEKGHLNDQQDYLSSIGHCYKCETILEPILKDQWFVKMKPLVERSIASLENNEIDFYPKAKKKELLNYYRDIQDWNISRQIIWGIPIPVFENVDKPGDWRYDERVDQEIIEIKGQKYRRDPDVFDTWWSSGQWPYIVSGYPDNYPTDLMETGSEILKPWVSRMITLSLFATDQIPFKTVYLHGMIVDKHGYKISKSKGNVINPLDVIEEYGCDSLRLSLINGLAPGQAQPFDLSKVKAGRNFCNKLWNIARYIQMICKDNQAAGRPELKTPADNWIVDKLDEAQNSIDGALDRYNFNLGYETIYNFVWHSFADWYLEAAKLMPNTNLLNHLFRDVLRLVHPWMPFVSEAIYQELYASPQEPLLIENTYQNLGLQTDGSQTGQFEDIRSLITEIRQNFGLEIRRQARLSINRLDQIDPNLIKILQKLPNISEVQETGNQQKGIVLTNSQIEAVLVVGDKTLEAYRKGIQEDIAKQETVLEGINSRLANQDYLEKAPKELIDQSREDLEKCKKAIANLKKSLQYILDE